MNETSLFGPTLVRALKIAWNHKFLWFFGIFTAIAGGSGEFQVIFRSLDGLSTQQTILNALTNGEQTGTLISIWNVVKDVATTQTGQLVIWSIVLLIVSLFVIAIVMASQAAVIDSAARALNNETPTLDSGWLAGVVHFWKMVGITVGGNIVIWLLYLAMAIPLGLGFYYTEGQGWTIAFALLSVFIFLPVAIILSFIIRYAQSFAVIENRTILDAAAESWKLFRGHWVVSIEMAVVIFVVMVLAYLLLVLGLALVVIPFYGIAILASLLGVGFVVNVVATIAIVLAVVWVIFAGAFSSVFQWCAWVTFFMEIRKGGVKSRLAQAVDRMPLIFKRAKEYPRP